MAITASADLLWKQEWPVERTFDKDVRMFTISPSDNAIATIHNDHDVLIWDMAAASPPMQPSYDFRRRITSICVSPLNRLSFVNSTVDIPWMYFRAPPDKTLNFSATGFSGARCVAISPDANLAAWGTESGDVDRVYLWGINDRENEPYIRSYELSQGVVLQQLAFSQGREGNQKLFAASRGGNFFVWEMEKLKDFSDEGTAMSEEDQFDDDSFECVQLVVVKDGSCVAGLWRYTEDSYNVFRIIEWDMEEDELKGCTLPVGSHTACVSPDAKVVAVKMIPGEIVLLNIDGTERGSILPAEDAKGAIPLGFFPSAKLGRYQLVLRHEDGALAMWEVT
jgi:WD40 repeat protein